MVWNNNFTAKNQQIRIFIIILFAKMLEAYGPYWEDVGIAGRNLSQWNNWRIFKISNWTNAHYRISNEFVLQIINSSSWCEILLYQLFLDQ